MCIPETLAKENPNFKISLMRDGLRHVNFSQTYPQLLWMNYIWYSFNSNWLWNTGSKADVFEFGVLKSFERRWSIISLPECEGSLHCMNVIFILKFLGCDLYHSKISCQRFYKNSLYFSGTIIHFEGILFYCLQ